MDPTTVPSITLFHAGLRVTVGVTVEELRAAANALARTGDPTAAAKFARLARGAVDVDSAHRLKAGESTAADSDVPVTAA